MKTAIITGGTGAIGSALVEEFSRDYKVIFTYFTNKKKAAFLSNTFGAIGIRGDVADRNSAELLVGKFPSCDLLINNAGISEIKLFTDITELEWYKMIDVHLTGAFNYTQCVLPSMIRQKKGSIINISSIWGVVGGSCEVHYSTVKAGLIGFTKALAKEAGPSGVRVNAIAPGVIKGGMNQNLSDEDLKNVIESTSLMRIGSPVDVANAARYLESAEYVTGQVIGVDGGFF